MRRVCGRYTKCVFDLCSQDEGAAGSNSRRADDDVLCPRSTGQVGRWSNSRRSLRNRPEEVLKHIRTTLI